jgi:Transcriptional regulator
VSQTGDKRQQILEAAVRVFAAQGYDKSRVGDVAREAGVAYGLIYHYFDSKRLSSRRSSARRGGGC